MNRMTLFAVTLACVFMAPPLLAHQTWIERFDSPVLDLKRWRAWKPERFALLDRAGIAFIPAGDAATHTLGLERRIDPRVVAVRARLAAVEAPNGLLRLVYSFEAGGQAQVILQSGGVTATLLDSKQQRLHQQTLALSTPGEWHDLRLRFDDDALEFAVGDTTLGRIEWPESLRGDHRGSLVLAFFRAEVQVEHVRIDGAVSLPAPTRKGSPIADLSFSERAEPRAYPQGVTRVGVPTVDVEPARDLPPRRSWMLGRPDFEWSEFADDTHFEGQATFAVHVGRDSEAQIPQRLRLFEQKSVPQGGTFYFHVEKPGIYTLAIYFAGAKNLGNKVRVAVDGHTLYEDVFRGSNPKAAASWFREHIPVDLAAGPHALSINADLEQSRLSSFMMSVYFDAIGLLEGDVPLVYEVDAREPRPLGERVTAAESSHTLGRDFRYRFTNLPAEELDVELLFVESVTDEPGFRVFDVLVDDRPLLQGFDILTAGRAGEPVTQRFPVQPRDGLLELRFVGRKNRAQVNGITLKRKDGTSVVSVNAGASPLRAYGLQSPQDIEAAGAIKPRRPLSPWFESTANLVANPGFEVEQGGEIAWRPIPETAAVLTRNVVTGDGTMAIDDGVAHGGSRSLRLARTRGDWGVRGNAVAIDWTRPYRFTAKVKARGATGRTYLALQWLMVDGAVREGEAVQYDARGNGLSRGGAILGPTTVGDPVAGTFDWREISVSAQPPRGAFGVQFQLRSDENAGDVWFDDLLYHAGGETPRFVLPLSPFQAGGDKTALLLTREASPANRFSVRDDRDRQVFEGELRPLGHHPWLGQHAAIADFSGVDMPGRYTLHVGEMPPQRFAVATDAYLDLARHAAFFFYVARCGQEVPGYHQACHLDDALVASPFFDRMDRIAGWRDLVGGWHDAGDYGKFSTRIWTPIYALATLLLDINPPWRQYGGDVGDIASELMWGADYAMKIHLGGGQFYGKVNGGFAGGHPAMPPSLETDGIPETVDGFGRTAAWVTSPTPGIAAVLARASRAVRPFDAQRASRYLDVARTVYSSACDYWQANRTPQQAPWTELTFLPSAVLGAVELEAATGDSTYAREAADHLANLLPLLDQELYRKLEYQQAVRLGKGILQEIPFDLLIAPLRFVEMWPDHALAAAARSSVRPAIERMIVAPTNPSRTPFQHYTSLNEASWYDSRWAYTTEVYPQAAYVLAMGSRVLDMPAWRTLAERNLLWLTGRNPYHASYVGGLGGRQMSPWVGLMYVPGLQSGIVPGGITKGITWATGAIDWSGRYSPIGWGMPAGYPHVFVHPGGGWLPHGPAVEIWEHFNGPVILAATELHRQLAPDADLGQLQPLPLGSTNLVPNSGFEQTVENWLGERRPKWTVRGQRLPENLDFNGDQHGIVELVQADDAPQGRHYVRILKQDDQRSAAISHREPFIAVEPGQKLWLSVWVRGQGRVHLFAHEYEDATAARYAFSRPLGQIMLGDEWNRIDLPYVAAAQHPRGGPVTHVRFGLHLMPRGRMDVDALEVRRTPPIAPPEVDYLEQSDAR